MTDNNNTKKNLEDLLKDQDLTKIPQPGDIVKGKVISLGKNEVRLDISDMSTGVIRGREMFDESGEYSNLKLNDEAEATVLEIDNESGEIELSFRYAGHQRAWDRLKELMEKQEMVDLEVFDANKGGLMIKVGKIAGFMPVSQLSPEHYPRVSGGDKNKILEKLKSFVGQNLRGRIIAAEEADEKLITSEKAAMEKEQKAKMSQLKIGDTVDCKITAVTDFGAFVSFSDHMEGLIHISELAWQRIDDPRRLYKNGQEVKAEIISIEGDKIFLSIKKLQKDPWAGVSEKYKIGQKVKGKVLKINPFGLFVELDQDIHGLAHISELSRKPINSPNDVAKIGDTVEFKILSVEPDDHRLGLSIKALDEKTEHKVEEKEESTTEIKAELKTEAKESQPVEKEDKEEIKEKEKGQAVSS